MNDHNRVYFITGIDTDAGKSIVTGVLAREMAARGRKVITQKFVQTGCRDISEDIVAHREIMGIGLTPEDMDGTTCPILLSYPSSPALAARIDHTEIDTSVITAATKKLLQKYDTVLIEGAGGLMVPLTDNMLTVDYVAMHDLPVIVVTSPRLGSINHTLLTLETCRSRSITVDMLVYNTYTPTSALITDDTRDFLKRYLAKHHPTCKFKEIGKINR